VVLKSGSMIGEVSAACRRGVAEEVLDALGVERAASADEALRKAKLYQAATPA
jgi:hypothetical protein